MDSRVYFHQYRRPRVNNPTYISNNVLGSMTFFSGRQYQEPDTYRPQQDSRRYDDHQSFTQSKNNSHLSQYGANSMGSSHLSTSFNQKDVHNKQTSKFDIINLHPKEHDTSIKQYPRLTLENRDEHYYARLNQLQSQKAYNSMSRERNESPAMNSIAGKHTFDVEQRHGMNPQNQKQYFTPKMLNHMDELGHLS